MLLPNDSYELQERLVQPLNESSEEIACADKSMDDKMAFERKSSILSQQLYIYNAEPKSNPELSKVSCSIDIQRSDGQNEFSDGKIMLVITIKFSTLNVFMYLFKLSTSKPISYNVELIQINII